MRKEWGSFLKLVEQLAGVTPRLLSIAKNCASEDSSEMPPEHDPGCASVNGDHSNRSESPTGWAIPSSIFPWQELLDFLNDAERALKASQGDTLKKLNSLHEAREFFENSLKQKLRGERGHWPTELSADFPSSEEELRAGLEEIEREGGLELHQFIGELEQMVQGRDRVGA